MSDCLFCKIIAGEIPSAKVYEDDLCYAFKDISPLAPTHFLVVPKQHFASAAEVTPENEAVVGHIYTVIAKLAREMGFADGYRVVTNVGELAGQTVPAMPPAWRGICYFPIKNARKDLKKAVVYAIIGIYASGVIPHSLRLWHWKRFNPLSFKQANPGFPASAGKPNPPL